MPIFRCFGIASVFYLYVLFFRFPYAACQDVSDVYTPYTVRVEVTAEAYPLFQYDVVVLDDKGRQITDLTADDFEVFQDGVSQEVKASVYINHQSATSLKPSPSLKNTANLPQPPAPTVKEEDIRRNIVFFLDLPGYRWMTDARKSLNFFLDKQMRPGDNVAIVQGSYGGSVMDRFMNDKRELAARVDDLPDENHTHRGSFFTYHADPDNWITLLHVIRTLKDMPGQKILFLMSRMPAIVIKDGILISSEYDLFQFKGNYNDANAFGGRLDCLAEEAMRAGVIVNFLYMNADRNPGFYRNYWKPLPERTGGIYIFNKYFYRNGIGGEAETMINGRYIIYWDPPPDAHDGSGEVFHRVKVNVKRKDAEVHAAEGFYSGRKKADTAAYPLHEVIFSPYKHTDLKVEMTAGWMRSPEAGYILRSWMTIDAKNVKVSETAEGARIEIETAGMTTDINGTVHDFDLKKYIFDIKAEDIEWVRKYGIRFARVFSVKEPGVYTFHMAVRDAGTGNTGAVYQFVEVPDLGNKKRTLSNIFLLSSDADLNWVISNPTEEINKETIALRLRRDETPDPAFRTYKPGDVFQALMIAYNANLKLQEDGESAGTELRTFKPRPMGKPMTFNNQTDSGLTDINQLYVGYYQVRSDSIYARSEKQVQINDVGAGNSEDGILILQRFSVVRNMPSGEYGLIMYIQLSDKVVVTGSRPGDIPPVPPPDFTGSITYRNPEVFTKPVDPPTSQSVNFIINGK